jgi:hypothetical protein
MATRTAADVRRIQAAELWGMVEFRTRLVATGTGEAKLAEVDKAIADRRRSVDPERPATAGEWQAAGTGAQRALDSVVRERVVTRLKGSEVVGAIMAESQAVGTAAASSKDVVELAKARQEHPARKGQLRGIVARLGPDPNATGSGALYRWMGYAGQLRLDPEGPDRIALLSGDIGLVKDVLTPLQDVAATLEVWPAGHERPAVLVVGGVKVPAASGAAGGPVAPAGGAGGLSGGAAAPAAAGGQDGGQAGGGTDGLTDAELERATRPDEPAEAPAGLSSDAAEARTEAERAELAAGEGEDEG